MANEESSLSNWAGPYVTEMLGRGQALASQPYTPYQGPLTAGQSGLQDQAFQGLSGLSAPTNMGAYTPTSFTSGTSVQDYMSPYLEGALQPQYDAANRQAQIQQLAMQSKYGKAGAFGGSRQAVAGAELDRGLLDRMSGITGTGYQNAFEQAQKQFNTEQERQMAAQQNTNRYGLDVLRAQQTGGGIQRGIEQEGIAADLAQFEEERDYDKNNTLYMQSLLQGLPLETQTYSYSEPSGLQNVAGGVQDITNILDTLSGNSSSEAVAPEFQSLVDFYVSQGRTPEQAANDANAILGTG